jgi:hypothetical protein
MKNLGEPKGQILKFGGMIKGTNAEAVAFSSASHLMSWQGGNSRSGNKERALQAAAPESRNN